MARAHLIHGWIGAGKTTFARQLEDEVRGIRFSADEWYLSLYTEGGPCEHLDPTLEARLNRHLDSVWPKVLHRGVDVVLDFGFWQRERRDHVRQLAREVGAATKTYWVQCEEAISLERVRRRNEAPGDSWLLAEQSFDYLRQKYAPLDDDEVHDVIRTDDAQSPPTASTRARRTEPTP